jgi:hypothetical protein
MLEDRRSAQGRTDQLWSEIMSDTTDPTAGTNAIFPDKSKLEVQIDGRTVTMRRLGLGDALALAKLVARLAPDALKPNREADSLDLEARQQETGMALLMGVFNASDDVLGVIAPIFNVTPADLIDPNQFPLGEIPTVIQALLGHPDIEAVSKNFKLLLNAPALQQMTQRLGPSAATKVSSNS